MAPSHLHAQTHMGTTCRKWSPRGVQSNFIPPHMQDEDGRPQSGSMHQPLVTRLQSHMGSIAWDAMPFQGWLHGYNTTGQVQKKELPPRGTLVGTRSHGQGEF